MNDEIWKPIKDFNGIYQVSNLGRVKSLKRIIKSNSPQHKSGTRTVNEKIMNPYLSNNEYYRITIGYNGEVRSEAVHRLVASSFLPNPLKYKFVNHKDLNKLNNHVSNLEWCSNKQNCIHAVQNGHGSMSKLKPKEVRIINFILQEFDWTQKEIGQLFNVARKTINDIKTGKTWNHYPKIATINEVEEWVKQNKDYVKELLS